MLHGNQPLGGLSRFVLYHHAKLNDLPNFVVGDSVRLGCQEMLLEGADANETKSRADRLQHFSGQIPYLIFRVPRHESYLTVVKRSG